MSLRMEDAVDVDHVSAKNSSKILLLHILSSSALEEMSSQQQYTTIHNNTQFIVSVNCERFARSLHAERVGLQVCHRTASFKQTLQQAEICQRWHMMC